MRAMVSLEPPAGNGTTTDTGRCGHSCAASAVPALSAATARTEPKAMARSQSCRRSAPVRWKGYIVCLLLCLVLELARPPGGGGRRFVLEGITSSVSCYVYFWNCPAVVSTAAVDIAGWDCRAV